MLASAAHTKIGTIQRRSPGPLCKDAVRIHEAVHMSCSSQASCHPLLITYIHKYITNIYTYMHTYTYTHTHTHAYIYIYTCTHHKSACFFYVKPRLKVTDLETDFFFKCTKKFKLNHFALKEISTT